MRHCLVRSLAVAIVLMAGVARAVPGVPERRVPEPFHEGVALPDYWVREQFQGIRAYWDGERLLNGAGEPLPVPAGFTGDFPDRPLEGRLWIGRGGGGRLEALLKRRVGAERQWRDVDFMVVDLPDHPGPFGERLRALHTLLDGADTAHLRLPPHIRVAGRASLSKHLQAILEAGGKGLILHRDGALYRQPRQNDLLHLRPYQKGEAKVVALLSTGQGEPRPITGLLLRTATGRHIRLREGFSQQQRLHPPPIGSVVRYAFYGYTDQGEPRSPRFLELRSEGPGFSR
ncbi:DNA ligase [Alcanivorax sp. N3-2A]|nr:DNA ligase [Alcanivorax sp. N3-2A]